WICFRVCRKSFTDLAGHAQAGQTFIKTVEELVRERPLAPRARWDRVLVEIDFVVDARGAEPSSALRGVHDLDERPMSAPRDEKMKGTGWASHDDRRQRSGGRQQQMIDRDHDLLRVEPQPYG